MRESAEGESRLTPGEPIVPRLTVLAYHNLVPAGAANEHDHYSIPVDRLVEHLDALDAAGFMNVPLEEAFARLVEERADRGPPGYALTFDDGYRDLATHLPRLVPRLRPTVFLLTRYADQSNLVWNTRAAVERRHLSVDQILMLAQSGVAMEFHGTDHHNLLKFDAQELHRRFQEGQQWFERILGVRPRFVAYPYGCCDARVAKIAGEYFIGGLSVSHGAWEGPSARFALNRVSVPAFLTGEGLVEVIRSEPDDRFQQTERRAPWRARRRRS
jgi:peptidoglycan/xylan/chitin deacetylase (PgdA/CDA1 family)